MPPVYFNEHIFFNHFMRFLEEYDSFSKKSADQKLFYLVGVYTNSKTKLSERDYNLKLKDILDILIEKYGLYGAYTFWESFQEDLLSCSEQCERKYYHFGQLHSLLCIVEDQLQKIIDTWWSLHISVLLSLFDSDRLSGEAILAMAKREPTKVELDYILGYRGESIDDDIPTQMHLPGYHRVPTSSRLHENTFGKMVCYRLNVKTDVKRLFLYYDPCQREDFYALMVKYIYPIEDKMLQKRLLEFLRALMLLVDDKNYVVSAENKNEMSGQLSLF